MICGRSSGGKKADPNAGRATDATCWVRLPLVKHDASRPLPTMLSEFVPDIRDELPAEPLVTITAHGRRGRRYLRELWASRDILYLLIWREVAVRYKQTIFGVAWAIMQPLFAMIIFSVCFGVVVKVPSDGLPYPLFAYAGLVPWTFFANVVTNGGNSLILNPNLVTKVYFPRMIIPGAAVGAGLVDFGVAFILLLGLMVFYGVGFGWGVLFLPVLVCFMSGLGFAVAIWLAALNVKYRDVRYTLPFLIQMWMFATPVIYPSSLVPAQWRWVLGLNPMTGIIEGYRGVLFARHIDWHLLTSAGVISLLVFGACVVAFIRMERKFADIV